MLRRREREAHAAGSSAIETIGAAVGELRESGVSAEEVQALLDRLLIMPVFTAHPTEAKRRTILTKLARIADVLRGLDLESPTPEEERAAHEVLREELVSLWRTEETRAYKPDVMDEVRNGLYYFESVLHDLAPEVAASLERAVAAQYPGAVVRPGFLRFGSWIGGDRDGNPFVTVAVTEETLRAHHELALRLLRRGIERLHGHLSTTERLGVDAELGESLRGGRRALPGGGEAGRGALPPAALPPEAAVRLPQAGGDAGGEQPAVAGRPPRPPRHLRRRARAAGGPAPPAAKPAPRTARSGWPTAAWRPSCARRRSSASTWRASTSGSTARGTRARSRRCSAATASTSAYAEASEDERARLLTARDPGRPALRAAPARLQPRHERDARPLPPRPPRPRAGRRRRGRELRGEHDARAERPARGPPDGPGRGGRRPPRRGPPLRDGGRPPRGAGDDGAALREPGLRPAPRRPRRGADDHGGVQRLQQGRRLPHRELGAAPRAARARRGLPDAGGRAHPLPRPGRHGGSRRRARRTARSSPSRRSRWGGACGSPSRASRSRTATRTPRSRGATSSSSSTPCSWPAAAGPRAAPRAAAPGRGPSTSCRRSRSGPTAASCTTRPIPPAPGPRALPARGDAARRDRAAQHRQPPGPARRPPRASPTCGRSRGSSPGRRAA